MRRKIILSAVGILISLVIVFPTAYLLVNSFVSGGRVSLGSYYQVFIRQQGFLLKFWNSIIISFVILLEQFFMSALAAYSLAKFKFRGRRAVFLCFIVLMMLPVQTILVPNYIVFSNLNLLNTWWPLIISGAFSPFGAVLLTQAFIAVPNELIEAAAIDGAGPLRTIRQIILPVSRGGSVSLIILAFIDAWNMVEQPVAFIRDSSQYPLSVFLAFFSRENMALSFTCGVLSLLPGLLLFLYYRNSLVEGVEYHGHY